MMNARQASTTTLKARPWRGWILALLVFLGTPSLAQADPAGLERVDLKTGTGIIWTQLGLGVHGVTGSWRHQGFFGGGIHIQPRLLVHMAHIARDVNVGMQFGFHALAWGEVQVQPVYWGSSSATGGIEFVFRGDLRGGYVAAIHCTCPSPGLPLTLALVNGEIALNTVYGQSRLRGILGLSVPILFEIDTHHFLILEWGFGGIPLNGQVFLGGSISDTGDLDQPNLVSAVDAALFTSALLQLYPFLIRGTIAFHGAFELKADGLVADWPGPNQQVSLSLKLRSPHLLGAESAAGAELSMGYGVAFPFR